MECGRCEFYKVHNCKHQCMDLPDGKTCANCAHAERCIEMFGAAPEKTSCGWEPIRFKECPCSWHDRQRNGCAVWCEYAKVGTCKCVINNINDILKDGDITRLQSLVPKDFTQIIGEAVDVYLIYANMANQIESTLDMLEPFLNWCERTGNEFNSKNYQEFMDQETIEEIFKDN